MFQFAKNLLFSSCKCKIAAEGQDFHWWPTWQKLRETMKNRETSDSKFVIGLEWHRGNGGLDCGVIIVQVFWVSFTEALSSLGTQLKLLYTVFCEEIIY